MPSNANSGEITSSMTVSPLRSATFHYTVKRESSTIGIYLHTCMFELIELSRLARDHPSLALAAAVIVSTILIPIPLARGEIINDARSSPSFSTVECRVVVLCVYNLGSVRWPFSFVL